MNKMRVLIQREFWEHRDAFVTVPVVIAALIMVAAVVAYLGFESGVVAVHVEEDGYEMHADGDGGVLMIAALLSELERMPADLRDERVTRFYWSLFSPFYLVFVFVVFFYLIDALYQERRDRSVLFWKSMPVSDRETVLAKLFTATVAVPLVYLACAVVLQLFFLLFASLVALLHGVPLVDSLLRPSLSLPAIWLVILVSLAFFALWTLPFHAWLLFVSAFARSVPFIWALGIPIAVVVVERVFTGTDRLAAWFGSHAVPFAGFQPWASPTTMAFYRLVSLDFVVAVVVGLALLQGAAWWRGKTDEF